MLKFKFRVYEEIWSIPDNDDQIEVSGSLWAQTMWNYEEFQVGDLSRRKAGRISLVSSMVQDGEGLTFMDLIPRSRRMLEMRRFYKLEADWSIMLKAPDQYLIADFSGTSQRCD